MQLKTKPQNTNKIISLRAFITMAICLTVTVILVLSGMFYYNKTARILMENYEKSFTSQLSQVNQKISDRIPWRPYSYPICCS